MLGVESAVAGIVDLRAHDVGGQHVGRELDALKVRVDGGGERAQRECLGESRHAFEQQMTVGDQADQEPVHEVFLADDDPADFLFQRTHPGRSGLHGLVDRLDASVFARGGIGRAAGRGGDAAIFEVVTLGGREGRQVLGRSFECGGHMFRRWYLRA